MSTTRPVYTLENRLTVNPVTGIPVHPNPLRLAAIHDFVEFLPEASKGRPLYLLLYERRSTWILTYGAGQVDFATRRRRARLSSHRMSNRYGVIFYSPLLWEMVLVGGVTKQLCHSVHRDLTSKTSDRQL